jgi:hypothetical protein
MMKKIESLFRIGVLIVALTGSIQAQSLAERDADSDAKTQRAETFTRMIIDADDAMFNLDVMIAQLSMSYPEVEFDQKKLRAFFEAHCRLAGKATEITAMLAKRYTAVELEDMVTFYRTDTGTKLLKGKYCEIEVADLREMSEFFASTAGGQAVLQIWFPSILQSMKEKSIEENFLELLDTFEIGDASLRGPETHES